MISIHRHRAIIAFLSFPLVCFAGCGGRAAVKRSEVTAPLPSARTAVDSAAIKRGLLKAAIDSVLANPVLAQAQFGVYILSLDDGRPAYALNQSQLLVPASANKLFITALAYRLLGPYSRFMTTAYGDSIRPDGLLKSDLCLKGFGDPDLKTADLDELAFRLRCQGLAKISGSIVVDGSYFDTTRFGAGWMWDEGPYAYNAPIAALSVNRNNFEVGLAAGPRPGAPLAVHISPSCGYFTVENTGITAFSGVKRSATVTRAYDDTSEVVTVSGVLNRDESPRYFQRSVSEPLRYAGHLFAKSLRAQGVQFNGKIKPGAVNARFIQLAVHRSEPLYTVIQGMDKESDNFTAEMLYRYINQNFGFPTDSEGFNDPLKHFLGELGFPETSFTVVDGSGLSRYNLCSCEQLVAVLRYLYADPVIRPELLSSLPVGGLDGTLANRLQDPLVKARVRAKTGTMTGICSLAGFAFGDGDRAYCFALMFNNYTAKAGAIRAVQDEILKRLLEINP
jgi:D-alanyl-D-alanine carboxypeptidase/D-alanyl-D-alanine-endopeptidase (penicillin-binding protein 4)